MNGGGEPPSQPCPLAHRLSPRIPGSHNYISHTPRPRSGTGLPLPVAPRCVPPLASSSGASRHQGCARVTLEFVVRLALVSPVSPSQELYLPTSTAAPDPWRLRVALFSSLQFTHTPPLHFACRDQVCGLRCSRRRLSLEVATPPPHPGPGPRPEGESYKVVAASSNLSLDAAHGGPRASICGWERK